MGYYIHDANCNGIGDLIVDGKNTRDALNNYIKVANEEGCKIVPNFKLSKYMDDYDFTVGGHDTMKKVRYKIIKPEPMVTFES